jgi:hypothetical protein
VNEKRKELAQERSSTDKHSLSFFLVLFLWRWRMRRLGKEVVCEEERGRENKNTKQKDDVITQNAISSALNNYTSSSTSS